MRSVSCIEQCWLGCILRIGLYAQVRYVAESSIRLCGTSIAGLSRVSHNAVVIQYTRLVVGGFEYGGATHCGSRSGDNGIIGTRDAE